MPLRGRRASDALQPEPVMRYKRSTMTSMQVRAGVWVSMLAITAPLVACGASEAAQGGATTPGHLDADADAPASQDTGPTTTTVVALGSGGDLEGSELTAPSTQTRESSVDGGTKGPHSIEIGRGIKDIQAIIVAHRDEARACYDSAI